MSNRLPPPSQSAGIRKSRLEGKPSYLPKPRHAGSIDRLSSELRRPSGARSSSADPPRATIGSGRHSREASATKIPLNRRSRSQQGDSRYGQASMTPLRKNTYMRGTTTPVRTPSEDRSNRSWQTSLDRALAFVTIKDQRALSSAQWQRAEFQRVSATLSARMGGGPLVRPLTIARFVELAGGLLTTVVRAASLNSDNYITKMPHIAKLLLYPGVVSKSWLRTVNTLHAFPHALALLAYLLDLSARVEQPVTDEWLYLEKDDLAVLRRDYLYKCWLRFQEPENGFDDLDKEYMGNLKQILGNDDEKIHELTQTVTKYESCLEDAAELAAQRAESARADRRTELLTELRAVRARRVQVRAALLTATTARRDRAVAVSASDGALLRAQTELVKIRKEIEEQSMSVVERTKLLDEVDYSNRVQDSKRALAEQISKMILSKESELALWQNNTLSSCVEYKQGLIHLSAQYPDLAALAIDENELMSATGLRAAGAATDMLRARAAEVAGAAAAAERARAQRRRRRDGEREQLQATIATLRAQCEQARTSLAAARAAEVTAESSHARTMERDETRLRGLVPAEDAPLAELERWRAEEHKWRTQLASIHNYIKETKMNSAKLLEEAKQKRAAAVCKMVNKWCDILDKATDVDNEK